MQMKHVLYDKQRFKTFNRSEWLDKTAVSHYRVKTIKTNSNHII